MKFEVIELKNYFQFLGDDGRNPTLKAYLLDNLTEMGRDHQKRPCLVICPGGGYEKCSQRESEPVALNFLPEGFHVFVLNYSVAPNRFPLQLREVAAVMELLHQNAERWHCDVSHVAIMGFSAGGHLAAHYSTSYDCPEIRDVFPRSKPVQAVILCYPVITADPKWAHLGSFDALIGKKVRNKEEIKKFSCNKHVTKDTPPTFLWHTAEDADVSVMNSLLYAQALAEKGVPFEYHVFPKGEHGSSTSDEQSISCVKEHHRYNHVWLDNAKKWLHSLFAI